MTKENIPIGYGKASEYSPDLIVTPLAAAHISMDVYAKQQAIAFANHIAHNDFKPHDVDTWNEGKHNTHELYDDFLQHQFIEQQNKGK